MRIKIQLSTSNPTPAIREIAPRVRSAAARFAGLACLTLVALGAGQAQALYIDFADYQGAESGNAAQLSFEGLSISISSSPTDFELEISEVGLGVRCTAGFFGCLGNQSGEIDAAWNEAVTITFEGGPVAIQSVDLERIYRGEVAVVATPDAGVQVRGSSGLFGGATARVDMGGVVTRSSRSRASAGSAMPPSAASSSTCSA